MPNTSATFVPRARLIEMLASSVGNEKSQSLIDEALAAQGMGADPHVPVLVARSALDALARRGGVIGAAARLALVRLGTAPAQASAPAGEVDLTAMLSSALGQERAAEQVSAACKRLSLNPARLSREQATRVLEALGAEAGLVGVTARFAKARLLLSA